MKSLRASLGLWWREFRRRKKVSRVEYVASMNQVPQQLGSTLFVVGNSGVPKWAVLECPCRCGNRIDVNLMRRCTPHWKLISDGSVVTIQPSIWQPLGRCGSHFFIVDSRIRWVGRRTNRASQ